MVAHTAKIAVPHCSDVRPVLHTGLLRANKTKDKVRLLYIHQQMLFKQFKVTGTIVKHKYVVR